MGIKTDVTEVIEPVIKLQDDRIMGYISKRTTSENVLFSSLSLYWIDCVYMTLVLFSVKICLATSFNNNIINQR